MTPDDEIPTEAEILDLLTACREKIQTSSGMPKMTAEEFDKLFDEGSDEIDAVIDYPLAAWLRLMKTSQKTREAISLECWNKGRGTGTASSLASPVKGLADEPPVTSRLPSAFLVDPTLTDSEAWYFKDDT